jgi:Ca-activated chloride channel family protein
MLLAPLALLLSVLAVPIILMYVLKLRRQEHMVPSTFLWRQVLEDVQANAPWQRLRFNLLLLLQLLALAALVLALARPAYSRSHVIAGDLIVIVDESYGMQAHDVSPARFDVALARARVLASELGGTSVMSVIGMGAQPHLALAASGDQGAIRRAIDGLRVGVDQPNFLEALSLAASLARAGQSTRVVVLTSRDSGISTLPLHVNFPVDIERIGGRLRDLGVIGFSASQGTSAVQAVARVGNFGSQTARSDLELFVDGQLADVRPLVVGGRREQNLFWSDIPSGAQRLQVHLTLKDSVGTDKSAWAAVPVEPPRRVLLVSRGDFFLEAALADDPAIRVSIVPPSGYSVGMERAYDLAIFDGVLPPAAPAGSALLIAPPIGQFGPIRFARNVPAGTLQTSSAGPLAALVRYVDLSDVHIAQIRSVTLPGWMQPLATSNGHTILAAGEQGNARFALVSFDLQHSDWPLRVSFPVMLQNLLQYLAPGLTLGQTTVTTGQAVTLFPPPGTRRVDVVLPDGTVKQLKPPFPPFTDSSQPGLYTVKAVGAPSAAAAGRQAAFAVNFFPTRPAPAAGPATLHVGHIQAGGTLTTSIPISIIWVFEVVALLLLAGEWWISFRGTRLL